MELLRELNETMYVQHWARNSVCSINSKMINTFLSSEFNNGIKNMGQIKFSSLFNY